MKAKLILCGLLGVMLAATTPGCKSDKEGCTDSNADNFDSKANKNTECRYRHASNIDISDVPSTKSDGTGWDDGDGPDLKINFGKKSSSGYDYSTNTAENATNTSTVTPNSSVRFSNEDWKYELVDVDLLGSEVVSSGVFNPLRNATNNTITVVNNGVTVQFKYTIE